MPFGQPSRLLPDLSTRARQLSAVCLGLVGLLSNTAVAAPGDHIRVGDDFVITPDVDVGFEYRSNAFRADQAAQGTGALRVAPGISITGQTPSVTFGLDGEYSLRKYLFLANPENLPQEEIAQRIANLDRFNDFAFGAKLSALRDRTVGVSLADRVILRNNPNDNVIDSDDPYATQIRNTLNGGLDIRPGPALHIQLGGQWAHSVFFVPTDEVRREAFNVRDSYGPNTQVKWMFFPRTAFVFNASYMINNWQTAQPDLAGGTITVPDSQAIKVDTGVQGRLTERLRLLARVGFGAQIFEEGPNLTAPNALLFTLQGDYDVADGHKITAGYRKSFSDSFFTNSVSLNALYARWRGQYAGNLSTNLEIGTRFEGYTGATERKDIVTQLGAGVHYKIQEWASAGVDGGWLQRASTDDIVEYDDVRVLVGGTFTY